MLNFSFYNPVHVEFGKDCVAKLAELAPVGKIMLIYGGGSVKRNGAYDQVKAALANATVVEFQGIEPNPRYETCMKAVELTNAEKVDFLLAVGGGSVLDATKFIAAAAKYEGEDPWDILAKFEEGDQVKAALPLGAVMTLPATGSEMNCTAVISRNSTNEKLHFGSELVFPKFSLLDPAFTTTLPERQTANGLVDTFVHTVEQYVTIDVNTPLQDRMSEGVLQTIVEQGPLALEQPDNYDIRANIFWCATVGLNGWLGCGVMQDWGTHMIGHELTAIYGLDHARTLAIVLPALWNRLREQKKAKLLQYGKRIWEISNPDDDTAIDRTITATASFFNSLGVPTSLADYGIDPQEAAQAVQERFAKRREKYGEKGNIDAKMAYEIVSKC